MIPSDEIINKVLAGLATQDEAEQVAQWFGTDEGHKYLSNKIDVKFLNLKDGFEELYVAHDIPSDNIWKKIEKRTFFKKKYSSFFRIAVILIPFIFIAGLALTMILKDNTSVNYAEISSARGQHRQLTLPDGTHVFLNADSKLSYPKQFTKLCRKVKLVGEAYFDVTKDEKHPFIIELGNDLAIEVLGTSFNTKAYTEDDNIEIALDEGKINLISSKEKHLLLPQEKLIYNKNSAEISISKNEETQTSSEWKNNIISFNNTSLSDVIKTLNRQYNIEFKVENTKALKYSYTLTTKKETIKDILIDLEKISPVLFVLENDTVKIRIK